MVEHKVLKDLNIKIFADGANLDSIKKLNELDFISGFTTNPSLMKKAGVVDYKKFANELVSIVPSKPISFEVFADDLLQMEEQALEIASWGENINVKIPIMNTKGELTDKVIKNLSKKKIKLNITAIFTIDQIKKILAIVKDSETILSIFAGRIYDCGIDAKQKVLEMNKLIHENTKCKSLWASTRMPYDYMTAIEVGTDIITMQISHVKKMEMFGFDLTEYSKKTVKQFYQDARTSGFDI